MVSCSHVFIRINLTTSLKKLSLRKRRNYEEDDDLEKPTILDMYMIRTKVKILDGQYDMDTFQNHHNLSHMICTDVKIWDSQYDMNTFQNHRNLSAMSFYEFAKIFYVRNKSSGEVNYHIKKHIKDNLVIIFTPVISTHPAGSNYHEFFRLN